MRPRARNRWLALSLCLIGACSGARENPCVDDGACPPGTACQLDGSCGPRETAADARFARHLRVEALDWGSVWRGSPSSPSSERTSLELGGERNAALYLAFGPIPEDAALLNATLTLHMVDGSRPGPLARTLLIRQTLPFESHRLGHRSAPPSIHRIARQRVDVAGGRALHVELGEPSVRRDRGLHRNLYLVVQTLEREGDPLRIASPRSADPSLRPRLDIRVR